MKYIVMGFEPRTEWERCPRTEHDLRLAHHRVTQKALIRGAALAFTAVRLRPRAEATTVRVQPGKAVVSDGPYAETKEVLGRGCHPLVGLIALVLRGRVGRIRESKPTTEPAPLRVHSSGIAA